MVKVDPETTGQICLLIKKIITSLPFSCFTYREYYAKGI